MNSGKVVHTYALLTLIWGTHFADVLGKESSYPVLCGVLELPCVLDDL
jgi:hypothetical protein